MHDEEHTVDAWLVKLILVGLVNESSTKPAPTVMLTLALIEP